MGTKTEVVYFGLCLVQTKRNSKEYFITKRDIAFLAPLPGIYLISSLD